jgi:hypothetical protein
VTLSGPLHPARVAVAARAPAPAKKDRRDNAFSTMESRVFTVLLLVNVIGG